jgi:DNA-binding MarR family transcriptional regulator
MSLSPSCASTSSLTLTEADARLASLLFHLSGHGQRIAADVLTDFKITANELAVLQALDQKSIQLMVKDIHAALTELSPSTLTRVLDNLERKLLVVRSLNPADRRSFQVALSDEGRQLLDAYRQTLLHQFAAAARPLSSGEKMLLTEMLDRILAD